jgi:hypothetical protein
MSTAFVVKFLQRRRRGWSSSEQVEPRATQMDLVYIQELDEKEGMEQ